VSTGLRLTPPQRRAIETLDRGLQVSAGAGSGKTAVLAERCVHCFEADPGCTVDRVLVVTFTDAAADEMRTRIEQSLRARLAQRPHDRRLREQIALVAAAPISTLHAFCRRLLARFAARAEIDPAFRVLDEHDAALLRHEVLDRFFDDLNRRAERDDLARRLDTLIAETGEGRDASIRGVVDALDRILESVVDRDDWLDRARARFASESPDTLTADWAAARRDWLREELSLLDDTAQSVVSAAGRPPAPLAEPVAASLADRAAEIARWHAALADEEDPAGIDALCRRIAAQDFPRKPRRPRGLDEGPREVRAAWDEADRLFGELKGKLDAFRKSPLIRFSGADWAAGIARTASAVHTLVDLVGQFRRRYDAEKRRMSALDFADLERHALRLLRDPRHPDRPTPVALRLRERYLHVLVDEFQDINPVQAEILARVSRERDPDAASNLFAVGDVKQSIYCFRLAEPRLFLRRDRLGREPNARVETIDLTANFRSDRPILDFVNALFERLMRSDFGEIEYDDHARLRPGDDRRQDARGPRVELQLLPAAPAAGSDETAAGPSADGDEDEDEADDAARPPRGTLTVEDLERIEREAYWIADRILALRREEPALTLRDIVVLMRSPGPVGPLFVRVLQRRGIPVQADLSGGVFESAEFRDLHALLQLLDNAQQDIPLAAFLRSPLCPDGLTDDDLVTIRLSAPTGAPFHRAVFDYSRRGADDALRARLADILRLLRDWRRAVRRRPLPDVLSELLTDTGYRCHVSGLPEGPQRLMNVQSLHELARRFGGFARQGLHRFLDFLDDLNRRGADLGAQMPHAADADAVRVLSIHAAKGLEFPVVFLADLGRQFNQEDTKRGILFHRDLGLGLRAADAVRRVVFPALPHQIVARRIRADALAEEMRILYVALTRARRRLILVGTTRAAGYPEKRADGCVGPLPLVRRARARRPLDWILPALAAFPANAVQWPDEDGGRDTPSPAGEVLCRVSRTSPEEMADWSLGPTHSPDRHERLRRFAALEPYPASSADLARFDDLFVRLNRRYAHEASARLPAVMAASELKQRFDPLRDREDPAAPGPVRRLRPLAAPEFVRGGVGADEPSAVGLATHLLLQRVDLGAPCDRAGLRRQLDELVAAGRLTPDAAGPIDLEAVAWFFGTDLGGRLRAGAASVRRETPFVYARSVDRLGPDAAPRAGGDFMVVRGIIDCHLVTPADVVLIDYKTDRIAADALAGRADLYRPQLDVYAEALEAMISRPVTQRWLVFLAPRELVALPPS